MTLPTDAKQRFLWFICIAYVTQGIAQHFCLVAQPLEYYMLKLLGKNAAEVAGLLLLLYVPWMVKPLYGAMSDAFPLAGYRRKSYLFLAYGLGGAFYLVAAVCGSFVALATALAFTAVGMALGTTVICGLTLEVGRPAADTRKFQTVQFICYYAASIGSFLLGGLLCAKLLPAHALSMAAAFASLPCFVTAVLVWSLLDEEKTEQGGANMTVLKGSFKQFRGTGLVAVALFICCWKFSPGFGTPLYFYETKVLGFDQFFIGQLGAINSVGMIVGALLFGLLLGKRIPPRRQAALAVIAGTASTFAYLWLLSPASAIALEFFRGFANIMAVLTVFGLAADVSPRKLESTTIAVLIAASNIAEQGGNFLGANLYTHAFNDDFSMLIIVSAVATLACMLLVRKLPQVDQHRDWIVTPDR
jgi:BT1 family